MKKLVTAFETGSRLAEAIEFLGPFRDQEVLVIAGTRAAADELVREICNRAGSLFGVRRYTLLQLAVEAATERLVDAGKTMLAGVAVDALAARAVYECRRQEKLDWFEAVARTPGFFRALASTLSELRLNNISPEQLANSVPSGSDLSHLLIEYGKTLDASGLADAASIYEAATAAVGAGAFFGKRFPILWLDVAPISHFEREFIRSLANQSGNILAT